MARSPRIQLIIDAINNTRGAFGSIRQSLDALEQQTASVGRAMVGAFAGLVSVSTLKSIGQINSEWIDMSSRLRRVTADEEEFASVTERLGEVAESTWSGLNETIESYLSMQGPLADMGYTTQEQVDFVSALNNALVVSGAKKEVAASVQNALNKAMASGVLRGDNLNTVIEKGGRVAELLAQKMRVTVSELDALGAQGKITGDVIYDALAGNMQLLAEEADAMPATFEDAMQRVNESITGAFRDEDLMEPLTDSLLELSEVLNDPAVRQGLASLASGLAGAASATVEAAAGFGHLGRDIGYEAARLSGYTSELDKLDKEIERIDRNMNAGAISKGLSLFFRPNDYALMSADALKKKREELEEEKQAILDAMTGTTAEMRAEEQARQAMLAEEKAKETALHRKYVNDLKDYNKQALDAVEARGKELAKAEKDAAQKILAAKKEAETLLKQFDDIRQEISGGGAKEPSYGEYQQLAAMARQALAAGDTEKAKENALAAANVLRELAAAGENTFGFAGLVKSMQDVAKSATDIEQANAEAELENIKAEMADLAVQAEALKEMPISMQADEASLEAVKSQITALLEQLKIEAVIPVRMEAAGSTPDVAGSTPGFAEGGWTGPGSKYKFAGFVHADEHVQPKRIVREPGALQFLEYIRRNGFRNTINRIKGYAEGGLVGASYKAPNISQNLLEAPQQKSIGTLNFNLPGGESFSVNTVGDFNEDLRRAALKYGKPRR